MAVGDMEIKGSLKEKIFYEKKADVIIDECLNEGLNIGVTILLLLKHKMLLDLMELFEVVSVVDLEHYVLIDINDENSCVMMQYILGYDVYIEDKKRYLLDEWIPTIDLDSFSLRSLQEHRELLDMVYEQKLLM